MIIHKDLQLDAPVLNALDASLLQLGYKRNFALKKIIEQFVKSSKNKSPTEIIISLPNYGISNLCIHRSLKIDEELYFDFEKIIKSTGLPKINILNRLIIQFNSLSDEEKISLLID